MYSIYKITNKVNGKIYVGQTIKSVQERFSTHIWDAYNLLDTKFARAIRKYGKDNFYYEIIDTANTKEELDDKERYWIKTLNSTNRKIGYNLCEGGEGGNTYRFKTQKEMREIGKKISKALSGDKNGNHTVIFAKNIENGTIKRFGSMIECSRYMKVSEGIIKNRIYQLKKHNFQSVFQNKWIFSLDGIIFSKYTFFQRSHGESPRKVTDLSTGEVFIGICKRECAEHFGVRFRRLETKRFKIEQVTNGDQQ